MKKISVSILAADVGNLYNQIDLVKTADYIHIDVMDGHFVENIAFGSEFVKRIRSKSDLMLDLHLMVENPIKHIKNYAEAGADMITVHAEAGGNLSEISKVIKNYGKRCGLCINPSTPLRTIADVITDFDLLLIMSVKAGAGGQVYIESTTEKIRQARNLLDFKRCNTRISVDGGITFHNIKTASSAGADIFVVGSCVYNSLSPRDAIKLLRKNLMQSDAGLATLSDKLQNMNIMAD